MVIYNEIFTENIFNDIINKEKSELNQKLNILNYYRQNLMIYMEKITSCIEKIENIEDTNILFKVLSDLKNYLDKFYSLEKIFNNCLSTLNTIEFNTQNTNTQIATYNELYNNYENSFKDFLTGFGDFIKDVFNVVDFQFVNSSSLNPEQTISEEEPLNTSTTEIEVKNETAQTLNDNNCLTISEKENKVFLPYKIKDLEKTLANSSFNNIDEIINEKYILPLERFKNPILSRFREAYQLMKLKENSSLFEAFNYALELSFNSTLNPAVITACRNKNELDIYLDCLEEKELEQFKIFEIKYELNPTLR